MAMTEYEYYYGFHEVTLKDRMQVVTNNTTRTILHNELVYLDGFFGEICEIDGIAAAGTGYLNFNHERLIRTTQVADDLTVSAGDTLYFSLQSNDAAGELTHDSTGNTAIGIVTDVDDDGDWVEFRPFVQPVGLLKFSSEDSRLDDLEEAVTLLNAADTKEGSVANSIAILAEDADFTSDGDISAATIGAALNEVGADVAAIKDYNPIVKEVTIDADASGGLDFSLATLGLSVGDEIINMWVIATATNGGGTLTVSHGNAGAAISSAMACETDTTFVHSGVIVSGVLTADGITVTANGAADRGRIFMMVVKA